MQTISKIKDMSRHRTIYSRFKDVADKFPDNPAVVEDGRTIYFKKYTGLSPDQYRTNLSAIP